MPYIFNSHDHVSAVLDGEIGKDISKKMAARTGITALGYTYSGGYRIIGSTDSVSCLDDLNTKNFISFTSPSGMLFDYAKVNHIPRHSATAADIGDMSEAGGAIETTYLRFAGKNVLKTNHSMFMTAILTSTDFLSSLTIKQQQAFKAAGDHVAKVERAWSIDDAEQYERDATSHGVTIVPISANDDLRLREAAKKMYTEDSIKKLKLDPKLVADIIAKGNNLK
jgi:TRAP-type C4-dicarboxylate transport system substrate-binding protein